MKTHSPSLICCAAKRKRRSGMALLVVLGLLVLISVVVIAFLSSASVELRSAKSRSSGLDARFLADSAVNVVISQVQDSTATPTLAWASQPGMIRNYDDSGQEVAAYKLYSSDKLKVVGGFDAAGELATEVPDNWASLPNVFTDLNKPVTASGTKHYPIIYPGAVAAGVSGGPALIGSTPAIEGCYLDTGKEVAKVTASQTNPVPLPVRWMYLLKDGTIAAIDAGTGKVAEATASNPIVGRMSFWTDDESCKVNVNTAAEGVFWDRPYADSPSAASGTGTSVDGYWNGYERGFLQNSVPAQNEFQRYPGHPATTSLSVIFPPQAGESVHDYNERIYGIAPRVVGGGSESGTVRITSAKTPPVPDTDRLFASVDEFLFKPQATGTRVANSKGPATSFTQDDIEKSRFFLTATSRAPEVNMFNKPRITLWPLQMDPNPDNNAGTRTAKDKLIAFCSTIGKKPYYFQRYNTYDTTRNARATTSYLSTIQNPIPSSQSSSMDWEMIARNQELYTYLQSLTTAPIPGLGGTLGDKYTKAVNDQILTEMMDYIRSNINSATTGAAPIYFYAPGTTSSSYTSLTGERQVVPLALPNGTRGFGRFPSVKQAVLVFYRKDTTDAPPPYHIGAVLLLDPFNVSPGMRPWCANVRFVVKGLSGFGITSKSGVAATQDVAFADPAVNLLTGRDNTHNATPLTGQEWQVRYYSGPLSDGYKTLGPTVVGSTDEEKYYPFYANFTINSGTTSSADTFDFSGGDISIEIYSGYARALSSSDLVQTIHMSFPPASKLPMPTPQNADMSDFNTRITTRGVEVNNGHMPHPYIIPTDVVRSVEARYGGPAKGDYRVYAALKEVPSTYFEGHGMLDAPDDGIRYSDIPKNLADAKSRIHSMRVSPTPNITSGNGGYTGSTQPSGKLVAGATYYYNLNSTPSRWSLTPVVPRGLPAALMSNTSPGDWDTGPANQSDGAYINKSDEGTSAIRTNQYDYAGYYLGGGGSILNEEGGSSYSPNRQCFSPVMFGSLPSGIDPGTPSSVKPWQTLLFCKNPAAGSQHPGFGAPLTGPPYTSPPDHAYLDLFTMPVVEPYAISEPFSTAGKVNMNYQIVPFTYLTRTTAVRAVLKAVNIMAIPTGDGQKYKISGNNPPDYRYAINPDETDGTLAGFQQRFQTGNIFRSASEICDIFLVPGKRVDGVSPAGSPTYITMSSWWNGYQLTGDNLRETPYGYIYPRLTTKSNTFTVYVKTQSLKKTLGTPPDEFQSGKDQITGEFRGSFVIQRYLDPNSDSLVGADGKTPTTELDPAGMVGPYKFRVLNSKRFAP